MATTRKFNRQFGNEAEILKDLIRCYGAGNHVTLPELIDNCPNISVLKLNKLYTFIKNNQAKLQGNAFYNDIKSFQDEIEKYTKTISSIKRIGGSLKLIALGALFHLLSFAQSEVSPPISQVDSYTPAYSQVASYKPALGQNLIATRQFNKSNLTRKSLRNSSGKSKNLEKVITFGQQADVYIYKTFVVKKFKGPNAEAEYLAELENMIKIQALNGLAVNVPIVKMLDHDDASLSIKYVRYDKDGTSLTSDLINGPLHTNGSLNAMAAFSPKAVSSKQVNMFVDAINKMHNNGIAHGDIHPGNIFLKDGKIGLADMALVKFDPRLTGNRGAGIDSSLFGVLKGITNKKGWEEINHDRGFIKLKMKQKRSNPKFQSFLDELDAFFEAQEFDNIKVNNLIRFFK